MIDLTKYEKEIRESIRKGIPPRPVPCIPGYAHRDHTEKELEMERENQRRAKKIYEDVKNGR